MFFHIKVSAKDKQTLKNFSKFVKDLKIISGFSSFRPKFEKRKFVTILKSPHVNKTAQEQFEYRFHTEEFIISSFKPLTFFLILKKLNNSSLFGLNLQIKNLLNKDKRGRLSATSPDNIKLGVVKNPNDLYRSDEFQQSKKYIQLFDCYGEMFLKHSLY